MALSSARGYFANGDIRPDAALQVEPDRVANRKSLTRQAGPFGGVCWSLMQCSELAWMDCHRASHLQMLPLLFVRT